MRGETVYCVKCGVRLNEGVERCPLCGTPVWNPDHTQPHEPSYPARLPAHQSESRLPAALMLTVLCVLVCPIILLVCFKMYGSLAWGGYALLGVALFYCLVGLPLWFPAPNPVVLIPVDHAAIAGFLLYVSCKTGGHWFLSFAFPLSGLSCLVATAMVSLLRYLKGGRFYIFGGFFLFLGGVAMLVEFFEHITFHTEMFLWSLYVVGACAVFGILLMLAATIRPLRDWIRRSFFI